MMKPWEKQNASFQNWASAQSAADFRLCTFSLTEIYQGIYLLAEEQRKTALYADIKAIESAFEGKILGFDAACAEQFGVIIARTQKQGLAMDAADALFLAVAERFNLSIVTRNQKHFEGRTELALLNPFDS